MCVCVYVVTAGIYLEANINRSRRTENNRVTVKICLLERVEEEMGSKIFIEHTKVKKQ